MPQCSLKSSGVLANNAWRPCIGVMTRMFMIFGFAPKPHDQGLCSGKCEKAVWSRLQVAAEKREEKPASQIAGRAEPFRERERGAGSPDVGESSWRPLGSSKRTDTDSFVLWSRRTCLETSLSLWRDACEPRCSPAREDISSLASRLGTTHPCPRNKKDGRANQIRRLLRTSCDL